MEQASNPIREQLKTPDGYDTVVPLSASCLARQYYGMQAQCWVMLLMTFIPPPPVDSVAPTSTTQASQRGESFSAGLRFISCVLETTCMVAAAMGSCRIVTVDIGIGKQNC